MATGTPADSGTQQVRSARHARGGDSASEAARTVVELGGELLELGHPVGDLGLLLLDQPDDPLLGGAAVRAGPDREQRR